MAVSSTQLPHTWQGRSHIQSVMPTTAIWIPGRLSSELKTAPGHKPFPGKTETVAFRPAPLYMPMKQGHPGSRNSCPYGCSTLPAHPVVLGNGVHPHSRLHGKSLLGVSLDCTLSQLAGFHEVLCEVGTEMTSLHPHWILRVQTEHAASHIFPTVH